MKNRWLLTWLLAPWFSPAAMAIEAYSLHWYRLDADAPTTASDLKHPVGTDAPVSTVRPEQSSHLRPQVVQTSLSLAGATRVVLIVVAVMLLASSAAAQAAAKTLVGRF
jgi:hypothetical protein